MKTRNIILVVLFVLFLSIISFIVYWKYYLFPSAYDFARNGEKYIEMINLLNQVKYSDVLGIGTLSVQLNNGNRYFYLQGEDVPEKYNPLIDAILEMDNTHFHRCSDDIIKISKGGYLNNFFELTYVYSKKGFDNLPKLTREKINDHIIVHHNYEGHEYSSEYYCKVR